MVFVCLEEKRSQKIKLIKLLNCFKFKNYLSLDKKFNKLIPEKLESHIIFLCYFSHLKKNAFYTVI